MPLNPYIHNQSVSTYVCLHVLRMSLHGFNPYLYYAYYVSQEEQLKLVLLLLLILLIRQIQAQHHHHRVCDRATNANCMFVNIVFIQVEAVPRIIVALE